MRGLNSASLTRIVSSTPSRLWYTSSLVKRRTSNPKARSAAERAASRAISSSVECVAPSTSTIVRASKQELRNYCDAYFNSLFLFFGAQSVIEGSMSVGKLIAFNIIASQVVQPILRLSQLWQDLQQVQVSVARLGEMSITPMNTSVKTRSSSDVRPCPVRKPRIVSSSRMRAIVCPAARVSKQASGSRKR